MSLTAWSELCAEISIESTYNHTHYDSVEILLTRKLYYAQENLKSAAQTANYNVFYLFWERFMFNSIFPHSLIINYQINNYHFLQNSRVRSVAVAVDYLCF